MANLETICKQCIVNVKLDMEHNTYNKRELQNTSFHSIFYHYGAEIPIEEISFQIGILNGHWESFCDHICPRALVLTLVKELGSVNNRTSW